MTRMKNYNALRRGINAALVAAVGTRLLAGCTSEPSQSIDEPPVVQVEQTAGHTILRGCFRQKGEGLFDAGTIGTIALADAVNGKPLTFTFTAAGSHQEQVLNQREVAKLTPYTPESGEWYTSPATDGPPEDIHCIWTLPANELPKEYDGRLAQVRYRQDGPFSVYGPFDHTSYIDHSCGPVTIIDGTMFKMSETSIPNQGPNPLQPPAEDC